MKYIVPLQCDENRQPTGVFSIFTSEGPLVIIFSNLPKWHRFREAAAAALARDGKYIASTEIEADSIDGVVDELESLDPAITEQATFVPDTAPIVADVLAFFEQQG